MHLVHPGTLRPIEPEILGVFLAEIRLKIDAQRPRVTCPLETNSFMIQRARLIGMLKPTPSLPPPLEAIELLMPMTSPFKFTSGPPELPGLIAASV